MLLSAVAPMNDHAMSEVLKALRLVRDNLSNLGSGTAPEVLAQYQRWSTQSAEFLGYIFDAEVLEHLLLTRRHWLLMETLVTSNGPAVFDTIRAEQTDRKRIFDAAVQECETLERAWDGVLTTLVAADTNVYLHHEQYFDVIDWRELAGAEDVRLLVPAAVVRELDKHKRAAKNISVSDTNQEPVRTRARVTGRRLRELLADPKAIAKLPTGIEVELVLDPLDHKRLDDTDSEIIDRMLTAQRLVGRPIAIVTDDGNMEFGAKIAGLKVIPLAEPQVPRTPMGVQLR